MNYAMHLEFFDWILFLIGKGYMLQQIWKPKDFTDSEEQFALGIASNKILSYQKETHAILLFNSMTI